MQWIELLAPALIIGSLLTLLAAPLGCLVVWRRMAFFSDSLAHSALLGIAIAYLIHLPMSVGILAVAFFLVLTLWFINDHRLPNDALLAGISHTLLAGGLIVISYFDELRSSMSAFLFGDLLTLTWQQVPTYIICAFVSIIIIYKIWHAQILISIHEDMAHSQGIRIKLQKLIFMLVLAGFTVLALQAIGSLLISSLLILPALTARLLAKSPLQMMLVAAFVGQFCFFTGMASSVYLDIASGLAIIMLMGMFFIACFGWQKIIAK